MIPIRFNQTPARSVKEVSLEQDKLSVCRRTQSNARLDHLSSSIQRSGRHVETHHSSGGYHTLLHEPRVLLDQSRQFVACPTPRNERYQAISRQGVPCSTRQFVFQHRRRLSQIPRRSTLSPKSLPVGRILSQAIDHPSAKRFRRSVDRQGATEGSRSPWSLHKERGWNHVFRWSNTRNRSRSVCDKDTYELVRLVAGLSKVNGGLLDDGGRIQSFTSSLDPDDSTIWTVGRDPSARIPMVLAVQLSAAGTPILPWKERNSW